MIAANQTPRAPLEPAHHVGDAELLEYAVGACDEAVSLAVACHLALCRACRAQLRRLDAIGGALLESAGARRAGRARSRAGSGAPGRGAPPRGRAARTVPAGAPRRAGRQRARAGSICRLRCSGAWPGCRTRAGATSRPACAPSIYPCAPGGATAQLLYLKPGLTIPRHDHGALEVTLVLTGALLDEEGRLARGDVLFREPGQRHLQNVEAGESCISLVVNAGSFVPLTWTGRLLRLIARP